MGILWISSRDGCDIISGAVETAIQAFILDTSMSNGSKIVEPGASIQPIKKQYRKSTDIISRKNISTTKGEMLFKHSGIGVLREITVVADQKINTLIELDGKHPFGARSEWDDLSNITAYSETIVARQDGSNYVLNIKNLYFKHDLSIYAWFRTDATISSVFGVYDSCELI